MITAWKDRETHRHSIVIYKYTPRFWNPYSLLALTLQSLSSTTTGFIWTESKDDCKWQRGPTHQRLISFNTWGGREKKREKWHKECLLHWPWDGCSSEMPPESRITSPMTSKHRE